MFWQLRGSVLDSDAILQARTEAHAVSDNRTQTAANSIDEVHVSWEGATSNEMLQPGLAYQWARSEILARVPRLEMESGWYSFSSE